MRNGKQGTGMPAFEDSLSDDEIRAVLSYIEAWQDGMDETGMPVDAEDQDHGHPG